VETEWNGVDKCVDISCLHQSSPSDEASAIETNGSLNPRTISRPHVQWSGLGMPEIQIDL
jgi:hypothetical protein